MIADAVGLGVRFVGGWMDCAVKALRWLAAGERPATAPVEPVLDAVAPQSVVEEAKYGVRPGDEPSPAPALDRETGDLPAAYGRDRIVLLPRDPWWTFAYWEVTPTSRVRALRALGADAEGAREILRVYDVTFVTFTGENAWLSFDVDLTPGAEQWHLNVGRPAASFCVEVGLRTLGGRFLPLARSNVVTTPRSSPSPDTTVRWFDLSGGTSRETPAWTGVRLSAAEDDVNGQRGSSDVHAPLPR